MADEPGERDYPETESVREEVGGWLEWTSVVLVEALGPFATDSYLPSLPMMAEDLEGGSAALVVMALQLSLLTRLITSTFTFATVRRRFAVKLFVASTVVFCGASAAASHATNIWVLCGFRVLQGAAEGNIVGSAAITPILLQPRQSFSRSAFLMKPMFVVLSPCIGGLVAHYLSWRWVFRVQGYLGIINMAVVVAAYFSASFHQSGLTHLNADAASQTTTTDKSWAGRHPIPILTRIRQLLKRRIFVGLCGITSMFMAQTLGLLYTAPFFVHYYYSLSILECGFLLGSIPFAGIIGTFLVKLASGRPTVTLFRVLTFLWAAVSIVFYLEAALDEYGKWYYVFAPVYCAAAVGFSLGPLTRYITTEILGDSNVALNLQSALQTIVSTSGSLMVSVGEPDNPHRTLYYMFNCTAIGMTWFLVVCGFSHIGNSIEKIHAKQHERAHLLEETTDGGSEGDHSVTSSLSSARLDWAHGQTLFWPSNSLAGSFSSSARRDTQDGSPPTPQVHS